MTTKRQLLGSVAFFLAAAGFTWFQLRGEEGTGAQDGMAGHNHSAMAAAGDARPVRLDPVMARRIGVTYATVERKPLDQTVEAVGTVAYDETRLTTVSPKIDGWVEHLYVDFTGAPVRAGQPLMDVYSPKLVSAQEELALAARLVRRSGEGRGGENARRLLEATRRRLAYWDVPLSEIRHLEETGEVKKTLTLQAPATGIVVEKTAVEGDRIMPGTAVFRIADLSTVWIETEVYEKDLALVRTGQEAAVRFEAFPGRTFSGRVTYVYPTVSLESRTARLRLELPNPGLELKPGMYARIEIQAPPEPPTEVVPRSALLDTGRRTFVFVQDPGGELIARDVVPGRTVGNEVQILEGLEAGERVVSSAAFLVDAESNLGTLPSAHEPAAAEPPGSAHGADHQAAAPVGPEGASSAGAGGGR